MGRLDRVAALARDVTSATADVARNIVFGSGPEGEDDDGVDRALERLTCGVLSSDRALAGRTLCEIVEGRDSAKARVARAWGERLLETLRETTEDDDVIRAALEATRACASGRMGEGRDACRAMIARDVAWVRQLVSELRGRDFYSRLAAAQTLREASESEGEALRASAARDPTAVPTLMDAMKENEVIRNEALLLLVELTKDHEELQKIVAFEGAFERAFAVMREEGGVEGGVVVQDCLELCNNLLRDNPSNQTLFRENGFVRSVPGLAAVEREIGNGGMRGISAQKAANALCALETVHLLVSPNQEDGKRRNARHDAELEALLRQQRLAGCRANQSELAKTGTVEILVRASLGDSAVNAVSVRVAALRALAALVRNHEENQTELFSATADRAGTVTEPALLACGRTALHSLSPAERAAASSVLGASMRGNPDGQLLLVSTLAPTGFGATDGSEDASLGGLLARALATNVGMVYDQASVEAARILRDMLHRNDDAKLKALRVNLEPVTSRANASELLLPRCVRQLAVTHTTEDEKPQVERLQTVILRLLIVWLYECKPAVDAFLSSPGHLPAIADLARTGGSTESPHVAALACVVLGCCLLEKAGSVLDVVSARVGLQSFFMKWEAMTTSEQYVQAAETPKLPSALTRANVAKLAIQSDGEDEVPPGEGLYDNEITVFINELEERVKTSIMSMYAKPSAGEERSASSVIRRDGEDDASYLTRLQEALRASEKELEDVRSRNTVLAEQLLGTSNHAAAPSGDQAVSGSMENGSRPASNEALQAAVEAAKRANAHEIENLKRDLEDFKRLADERQESLTSLSSAYNGLEAEVYRLESEATGLRAKLHDIADSDDVHAPDTATLDVAREAGRQEGRRLAEVEFETRMRDAVEAAVAEAASAHEAELNDLLACLGQEEASKEHLFARLLELGVDETALGDELAKIVIGDE